MATKTKNTVKSRKTTKNEKSDAMRMSSLDSLPSAPRRFKIRKSYIIGLCLIAAIFLFLFYFRGLFIVATVNGQPIDRLTFTKEIEKQSGKQVLNTLVTKALILQEAKKQNITISPSDIDAEIKKIEESLSKQNQKLDDVLTFQGMTRESLRDQIRFQKILEKLVGKDIKITDKDISDYIEKNKASFPEGTKPEDEKKQAEAQLKQEKMNEKIKAKIADLQKNAKINYFVTL